MIRASLPRRLSLAEIVQSDGIFVDGDWVESKDQDPDGDVRLIQLADVGDGVFVDKSARFLTSAKARELKCTFLERDDILVARMPDPLGRACVFPGDDRPCVTVVDVCIVRPGRATERRWLLHAINSSQFRRQIERHIKGATRQRISRTNLGSIELDVPPLDEQRRIADILDTADAIRRKRKEVIALTEELLRSAFLEMVGPAANDYAHWPVKTIEGLAAPVPNAMRTGPFGSDLRHSEFVDEGIAVLGIDNAVQNRFAWGERRFITKEKYESLRRYTVYPGDVIVTIMGTTGRSAVVPDDIPTAITTKHLATITLDREQAEPEFVSQALFRHPEALRQIAGANRGAIMSGLNLGLIKALRIPLPPIERQRKFGALTHRARAITTRMSTSDASDHLFNSLVASAFAGGLGS